MVKVVGVKYSHFVIFRPTSAYDQTAGGKGGKGGNAGGAKGTGRGGGGVKGAAVLKPLAKGGRGGGKA